MMAVGIGFTVITVATVVLGEAISTSFKKNLAVYAPEAVAVEVKLEEAVVIAFPLSNHFTPLAPVAIVVVKSTLPPAQKEVDPLTVVLGILVIAIMGLFA